MVDGKCGRSHRCATKTPCLRFVTTFYRTDLELFSTDSALCVGVLYHTPCQDIGIAVTIKVHHGGIGGTAACSIIEGNSDGTALYDSTGAGCLLSNGGGTCSLQAVSAYCIIVGKAAKEIAKDNILFCQACSTGFRFRKVDFCSLTCPA